VFLRPFAIASRPVTTREYLEFIDDGGYHRPELWMSLGWDTARAQAWDAPAYWRFDGESWSQYGLGGLVPLDLEAPVVHVSWFEADAFARWSEARLPTEAEWEHVARDVAVAGNFVESRALTPRAAAPAPGPTQLFGDVWEWTSSAYASYPGYRPPLGALGEYNGKFMCNQYVLRGGSCASPASHLRASYRNFFPPDARWQFSGVRLARDP
jgi:ergothioneine biosynthesis protein EgtB